jgi:hypothetical protein
MAKKTKKGKGDDEDDDEKEVHAESVQGSGLSRKQQRMQKLQAKELNKRTNNESDEDRIGKNLEVSDEETDLPQPISKKGKNKVNKTNLQGKGRFDVDTNDEEEVELTPPVANKESSKMNKMGKGKVDRHDESDEEIELPQPVSKKGKNKAIMKGTVHSNVHNESDEEEKVEEISEPLFKKGKNKSKKRVMPDKSRFVVDMEEEEEDEPGTSKMVQLNHEENVEKSSKLDLVGVSEVVMADVQQDAIKSSHVSVDSEEALPVEELKKLDINDALDDDKARRKAEKEARKLLKAQKEAAKREKNLELLRSAQVEERPPVDQDDDDGVMYGAPDDVVWTDKSAAMLEAEKLNKTATDLSVR